MTEYRAIPASRLSDTDARIIGGWYEQKFGARPCTAQDFVNSARPKRSPVHGYFDWDDQHAANEYRKTQAEKLLRSVAVVIREDNGAELTRAYHSIVVTNGQEPHRAYAPQQVVWARPDFAEQVLERARRELEAWTDRYRQYGELAQEVDVVENILAGMR